MSTVTSSIQGIAGQVSHRKLHLFYLVDVSGSMEGMKIQMVNKAIKEIGSELEQLEEDEPIKVLIRVIKFADKAEWYIGEEPVELSKFVWKDLEARPEVTATAQAIELLSGALDENKLGTRNVPPVCILLSDGYCTDPKEQYDAAIRRFNSRPWGQKAVRLSIGIGEKADYHKEQLDQFISPYLRKNEPGKKPIETIDADTPRRLVQCFKLASTNAARRASTTPDDLGKAVPVPLQPEDLQPEAMYNADALNPENLPDPSEVF